VSTREPVRLPLAVARRLALHSQRLAGPRPKPSRAGILEVVERLGCLQIDPTSVVARTQLLVLFSRLGAFDQALLDRLAYDEHRLFEYWAHEASFVLADDYPLHRMQMRTVDPRAQKVHRWLEDNASFREYVLDELRARGPLRGREIEDRAVRPWASTGWTNSRNVERLLTFLSVRGVVLAAGRAGNEKLWDLAERCLPEDVPREELPDGEVVRRAAVRALRALGPATPRHVRQYFMRESYPGLEQRLAELQAAGMVVPVQVVGPDGPLRGEWLLLSELLPLAEELAGGGFRGRTTLLSPFDNLICNRERTLALFGFRCKLEIYVPKEKREWGFYVLPIVHGDRLIGRADPRVDRATRTLHIQALHAEPGAPRTAAPAIAKAIDQLARFAGAERVVYERVDPPFEAVRE
jgi:uncharacterized protein YcaQ